MASRLHSCELVGLADGGELLKLLGVALVVGGAVALPFLQLQHQQQVALVALNFLRQILQHKISSKHSPSRHQRGSLAWLRSSYCTRSQAPLQPELLSRHSTEYRPVAPHPAGSPCAGCSWTHRAASQRTDDHLAGGIGSRAANHQNALNIMTPEQKAEWAKNEADPGRRSPRIARGAHRCPNAGGMVLRGPAVPRRDRQEPDHARVADLPSMTVNAEFVGVSTAP